MQSMSSRESPGRYEPKRKGIQSHRDNAFAAATFVSTLLEGDLIWEMSSFTPGAPSL